MPGIGQSTAECTLLAGEENTVLVGTLYGYHRHHPSQHIHTYIFTKMMKRSGPSVCTFLPSWKDEVAWGPWESLSWSCPTTAFTAALRTTCNSQHSIQLGLLNSVRASIHTGPFPNFIHLGIKQYCAGDTMGNKSAKIPALVKCSLSWESQYDTSHLKRYVLQQRSTWYLVNGNR